MRWRSGILSNSGHSPEKGRCLHQGKMLAERGIGIKKAKARYLAEAILAIFLIFQLPKALVAPYRSDNILLIK
jgi:hypothetical protein